MASRLAAQSGHDLAEHFARLGAGLIRPHGKHHLAAAHAGAHRPMNVFVADQEIDYLSGQLRVGQIVDPANQQLVVDERALQRL